MKRRRHRTVAESPLDDKSRNIRLPDLDVKADIVRISNETKGQLGKGLRYRGHLEQEYAERLSLQTALPLTLTDKQVIYYLQQGKELKWAQFLAIYEMEGPKNNRDRILYGLKDQEMAYDEAWDQADKAFD